MLERVARRSDFIGTLLLIAAASSPLTSFGQTSSPPPAAASPVFEVTTVKLNKSGDSGSHSSFDHGRFTASNILLKSLIQYQAYGIPDPRILGGPKWLDSERFDIEAKVDSSVVDRLQKLSRDQGKLQMQAMFQHLLADRFKLTVHWETRELPVYALVVARNGPNLHRSQEPDGSILTSAGAGQLKAQGITLAELARTLTQELAKELGRVVIDKTAISGRYDITLKWTPETGTINTGTEASGPSGDSGPSVFTAIPEQLGLRLESTKGPVQVLLIDHVEMPSDN